MRATTLNALFPMMRDTGDEHDTNCNDGLHDLRFDRLGREYSTGDLQGGEPIAGIGR